MISNIAFSIFGFDIYYYGLVYFFGFLISYLIFTRLDNFLKIKKNILENVFLIILISSIFGGRVFHILFYNLSYYLENPIKFFFFREGGMSIHGGLFFGILSLYFLSKKYKFNFFKVSDILVLPLCFFISIGRIANHINQELIGKKTDFFLGTVYEKVDNFKRHPTVLYESFCYQVLFLFNFYLYFFRKVKTGTISFIFIFGYNFIRFFLEFTKDTKKVFLIFSVEQILCILFMLATIFIYYKLKLKLFKH